jgi:histidyl-tRNA synthetase
VLGDAELADGTVVLKPLRSDEQQISVKRDELLVALNSRLAG